MSLDTSWRERKRRLWVTLDLENPIDQDEGRAVDSLFLQAETVQSKGRISELNRLRFTNRDLSNFGALAHGPFGSVDMVRCKLDNKLYVRKSVEKRVVTRNPSQCYPHHEKEILIAATKLNSPWAPHLLCTFQTHTSLCYVMDFAEGGSLGDLLETSGQITERDLKWWLPQMIVAINWCHSQGFCHRDIKPSNFVVTSTGHVLLIDFASSARLLPPDTEGVQLIPKESCLVLCGTCDYISPEILAMQEDALVALDDQEEIFVPRGEGGYGRETDWWSLGSTIYELVYGVAPFFAKDIRGTYDLIINHESKLRFPSGNVSSACVSLISGLLRSCVQRLGRRSIDEITGHAFLSDVAWSRLHQAAQPSGLQLPQFEYELPAHSIQEDDHDESFSKGYAFSEFFNSSVSSSGTNPNATNLTFARPPSLPQPVGIAVSVPEHLTQYVGFTWGPRVDAFDRPLASPESPPHALPLQTPLPASKQQFSHYNVQQHVTSAHSAPAQGAGQRPFSALVTPIRPSSMHAGNHPPSTIRRTVGGTARKAGTTRAVSDAEALRQMGDCVRASARKRLSHHAGRTPGPGSSGAMSSGVKRRASWIRMTLDFENVDRSRGNDREQSDDDRAGRGLSKVASSRVASKPASSSGIPPPNRGSGDDDTGLRIFVKNRVSRPAGLHSRRSSSSLRGLKTPVAGDDEDYAEQSTGGILFGTVMRSEDEHTSTTDGAPASPSPSPRPLSAMSRPTSSLSRRGITPMMHSSASLSAGGLGGSINISSGNANPQRPSSFHRRSISTSTAGTQSAPPSTKVQPQEPISIFRPAPPGTSASRSSSGSSGTPGVNSIGAFRSKPDGLARVAAEDLDADATPKAKPVFSSTRPIFRPPTPTFPDEPNSIKRGTVGDSDAERFGGSVNRKSGPSLPKPNRPLVTLDDPSAIPMNRNGVGSKARDSKFDEMEERLRVMMKDIEKVETGLKSAKARLDS